MTTIRIATPDRERLEAAASWRIRIAEQPQLAQAQEFLDWLGDPDNQEAFVRTSATWNTFDDHLASPQILAIRRDALNRARRSSLQAVLPNRRRALAIAASFALVVLAIFGSWQWLQPPSAYATGIGERRVVTLEDGSRISLDSDTAVRVHYRKDARELVLLQGRARFDVAHDITRPFTVAAGHETVVAVGTSFDVERLDNKVFVTLIEGHVVVKTDQGASRDLTTQQAKPVSLIAGQQLVAARDVKPLITLASLPVATAWESGRLILNNEPLDEAVERVNRYTNKPLQVDPAVANLRVSGVFNAGDVTAFVDAITSYFPVQASTSADDQIVLQKRS